MDHYSLELLAKLHHKGLVREGVRAQWVSRRLGYGKYRSRRFKRLFGAIATGGSLGAIAGPALTSLLIGPLGRGGLFIAAAIVLMYSRLFL